MARTKRPVAKVVLSLVVLAVAGAGVYFLTTGGWLSLGRAVRGSVAELVPDSSFQPGQDDQSPSTLDEVAGAWNDSPTADARQQSVKGPAATLPLETPTIHDPNVAAANYTTASDTGADQSSPRAESDSRYVAVGAEDDRYDAIEPAPTALPANIEDEEPVARGQDSDEDAGEQGESAGGVRSLRPSASRRHQSDSARRAREAFADEQTTPAGDRYGQDSSDVNPFRTASAQDPRQVNPFASQPAPLPAETKSADPIGPSRSPTLAEDDGVSPLPESGTNIEPINSGSSPRIGRLGSSRQYGSSRSDLSDAGNRLRSGSDDSYDSTPDGTGRPGERALEGPQQPSLVIQKHAPPEIQVGKPAKFIVQVQNGGNRAADEVVIRDEVPHGTRLVSTSPPAEVDGSHLIWDLGTLSAGEQRAVEVQVMPTDEGEIGSVATVSFAAPASVKTRCTMPQLAIRMTAPSRVMIGDEQRVRIELRNPGSGDATGVMLFENVPEQVRHEAGPTLEFEIGTLHAGETRELELILTAEKAGKVVNTLTARADANLQVQQEVEFEVIAPALELAVDGPKRRYLERPATYQVTIANPGTATAKNVEIVTKLPKGMRFIRANNMGEYDASTHAIYWSLAELPEGERGTVELVAMPIESGQHTLEVEGRAQQGLSDHTQQQVLVEGLAAIMFEVTDVEDPIEVGRETTYEIRVVNQGSKAATNVQVAASIPPGMKVVSANGETRHVVESGGVLFEPLAQLAPKAESIYRVQVQGVRPGDQRVTVEVNTDDMSQPVRKEESTRVFGDE